MNVVKKPLKTNPPSKLITCILPNGKAMPMLKLLKQEFGIISANFNHARGSGRLSPLTYRGAGEQTEKEILTVVVNRKQADEVFNFIFFNAEINRPHGGLIFQSKLNSSTHYQIPEHLDVEK